MNTKRLFFLLFFISLLPLVNLLQPGLPVTHDGFDHVARIANFYQSLSEGNVVPRWAANLNWGYGHPILMFLYPLPSYVASFFHFLGLTFVDSTKLVFAASYVFSVIGMYVWLNKKWGAPSAFVGGLLYGFAPYRFVDLYVRGAIGEHVAFAFVPFVFWGIDRLKTKRMDIVLIVSIAGLILSHNAISLMFLPLIFFYALFVWYEADEKLKTRFLFSFILSVGFGFLLSAFFWLPAFFEGKYTLRDIVTRGEALTRFVPLSYFFISPWNYGGGAQFSKEVGLFHWVAVVAALAHAFKTKDKKTRFLVFGAAGIFFLTLFFMTEWARPIWTTLTILQKFQFPWRLLSVIVFITSLLGAWTITKVPKRLVKGLVIVTVGILLLLTSHMWRANSYGQKPESFYSDVYDGTTDTGESSPIWSVRFMEKRPTLPIEIVDGTGSIDGGVRTTTHHTYSIKTETSVRLVENTLYFPGWRVVVNGQETPIEFQDPTYRGLMTFTVPQGIHTVEVVFGDTKLRKFANGLSVSAVVLLVVVMILPVLRRVYG